MATKKSVIRGAADIAKVLKRLPEKMTEQVLVQALRAGGKPIVKEAKDLVPVRSGDLKKSIVVRKATKKQRKGGAGLVAIGFTKPTSRRAHLIEYGTSTTRAQPFMRPALDHKGDEAIAAIGTQLGKSIEKAAKKLAGPLTRKQRRRIR